MRSVRAWLVIAGLVVVLGTANYGIRTKQQVLDSGREVLLELRPVDPRSLMQGDYMRLRYADKVFPDAATRDSMPRRGTVVMTLDADNVGSFARRDDGSPLAENELRLQYKLILDSGDLRLGAESFYFQEGQAEVFAEAQFGVLRVAESGASVLAGLADENRMLIAAP
jgi:uncharacterized membrane-anchored protein